MNRLPMTKGLWGHLVIPLILVLVISLVIHFIWPAEGFFINLSTEVVGIIITVFYVDWILKQHEKRVWLSTDKRVADRLRWTLISTLTGIRTGLGLGADILDQSVIGLDNPDPTAVHEEIARVAGHVIYPCVLQRISGLDSKGWKSLGIKITESRNNILTFLNLFQARLNSEYMANLLDLEELLSKSLTFYEVFPDIAGVSQADLPQGTRTPPEIMQRLGNEQTAQELQNALLLIKRISELVIQDV